MTESIDVIVVGAGVVGLATASALAKQGLEVIVVERHARAGEETSSRNSGVIHSGIYYPVGSLKAQLCVRGRELLYRYADERGITYRRCGKLIVAQATQIAALAALLEIGRKNGVDDLVSLSADEAVTLEPEVRCAAAIFSPSTGIIDVHEYLLSLQADLEAHQGMVLFNAEVADVVAQRHHFVSRIRSGDDLSEIHSRVLVNAAGLNAVDLLNRVGGYPRERLRSAYFAKGNYFAFRGKTRFNHLVYPMPNEAGLGVHATLDLDGTMRFGPDVEWVEGADYAVNPDRALPFYAAIREYFPSLPANSLEPAYAGIRPKLVPHTSKAGDFGLETSIDHGISGLINLLGIESPGLTASLAIAERVANHVLRDSPRTSNPSLVNAIDG